MPPITHSRRLLVLLSLLVASLLLAPAGASARAKRPLKARSVAAAKAKRAVAAEVAQPCANTDLEPDAGNLPTIRAAILCLHNQIRAQHGLPTLKANTRLQRAALGHSVDMVDRGYFAHSTPDGRSFVDRILAARYVGPDDGWSLGENLAWGTYSLGTPAEIMQAWMNSPEHRANVLRRAYREVGFGVIPGVPSDKDQGATYTADFGVRR
jgi:uncharacterized protein YkwD